MSDINGSNTRATTPTQRQSLSELRPPSDKRVSDLRKRSGGKEVATTRVSSHSQQQLRESSPIPTTNVRQRNVVESGATALNEQQGTYENGDVKKLIDRDAKHDKTERPSGRIALLRKKIVDFFRSLLERFGLIRVRRVVIPESQPMAPTSTDSSNAESLNIDSIGNEGVYPEFSSAGSSGEEVSNSEPPNSDISELSSIDFMVQKILAMTMKRIEQYNNLIPKLSQEVRRGYVNHMEILHHIVGEGLEKGKLDKAQIQLAIYAFSSIDVVFQNFDSEDIKQLRRMK